VIIVAGETALHATIRGKLREVRGRWFEREGLLYVATHHPARLLREPALQPEFNEDLKLARLIASYGKPQLVLPKVRTLVTIEQVRESMGRLLATPAKVAFDFETTGLRPEKPDFQVLTCAFSYGEGFGPPVDELPFETFTIPLYHSGSPLNPQEREEALDWVRKFLRSEDHEKIFHNATFEYQVALSLGVEVKGRIWDTMLLHHQVEELLPHNLDSLSWRFTPWKGYKVLAEEELQGIPRAQRQYGNIPLVTFEKEIDEETTRVATVEYEAELSQYWENTRTQAEAKAGRVLKQTLKKTGDEEQAKTVAQAAAAAIYAAAEKSKKLPKAPAPIFKNTEKVRGGLALYNGTDSHVTRYLERVLKKRVDLAGTTPVYETVLESAIPVFSKMMARGVKVDRLFLTSAQEHLERAIEHLERELGNREELADWPEFNWRSPKQLAELLFDRMKLKLPVDKSAEFFKSRVGEGKGPVLTEEQKAQNLKITESGQRSTDDEVLRKLARRYRGVPALILQMRELGKAKGTYVDAYLDNKPGKEAHLQADERVHTSYLLGQTATGRLSSRDPNLQNIPHSPILLKVTKAELDHLLETVGAEALHAFGWKIPDKDRNKGENQECHNGRGCDYIINAKGELKKSIFLKKAFIPTWEGGCMVDADYCLTGDTEVWTDRGNIPIKDLEGRDDSLVLTSDPTGHLSFQKPARFIHGPVTETLVLTFDNGSEIRCTPEHKMVLHSGEKRRADQLQEGDRILSVKTALGGSERRKYKQLYTKSAYRYQKEHLLVAEARFGPVPKGFHVHHKDGDPWNNAAENLEVLPGREHGIKHMKERWAAMDPAAREVAMQPLRIGLKENRRSYSGKGNPNWGKKASEHCRRVAAENIRKRFGPEVFVCCWNCKTGFHAKPSEVRRGKKFCSQR
jgi:DNA polymerase I-like protein with 3'-5' exonuclease and polymerase domains